MKKYVTAVFICFFSFQAIIGQDVYCDIPAIFPVPLSSDWNISSNFGDRMHPIRKRNIKHRGIDISAPKGTYVLATACGQISKVASEKTYGNVIFINHPNGYKTIYAHLSEGYVNEGSCVRVGDTIALVGSTGVSTGSHLHYEIRKYGKAIDPQDFLFLNHKMEVENN